MKKIAGAMAACILFLCALPAGHAESGAEPLSLAELFAWRDAVYEWTREEPPLSEQQPLEGSEGWLRAFSFGLVEVTDPNAAGNAIANVELLQASRACPRGIRVGDPAEAVLAAYPDENPARAGNRQSAALYLAEGGQAGEGYGLLLRNGQTIECLQYAATAPTGGMAGFWQTVVISYVVGEGRVTSIRVEGFANLSSDMEKNANFASVRDLRGQSAYVPPERVSGPFSEADLFFAGLDFAAATQADCQRLFGEPLEYAERDGVRSMAYADIVVEADVASGGRVDAVAILGESVEGPRGIRVGDAQQSVLALFGGDAADTLTYTLQSKDGQYYTLRCTFFAGVLTEFLVSRR